MFSANLLFKVITIRNYTSSYTILQFFYDTREVSFRNVPKFLGLFQSWQRDSPCASSSALGTGNSLEDLNMVNIVGGQVKESYLFYGQKLSDYRHGVCWGVVMQQEERPIFS